jgi:glycosyltransferase involved in cell wall biosynthesis
LTALAQRVGITAVPRPVVVASSRGISGLRIGRAQHTEAELTIYNTTAVAARPGDRRPRAMIVREWLMPDWRRHRALAHWHARRAELAVAVSSGGAEQWRACAGGDTPVDICPNWLDDSWLGLEPEPERSGVLFAGRLSSWKGQETLADAFELAFAVGEGPALTFLGAEPAPSPFHRNAEALRRRGEAHGWRVLETTPDPKDHFRSAALVVIPSLRPEPFGNVALEALAAGARVVTFPGGGIDDIAPRFPQAMEVCARGTGPLAESLQAWWVGGGSPQTPGEHARTQATLHEHYSSAAAAPRWRSLLERFA